MRRLVKMLKEAAADGKEEKEGPELSAAGNLCRGIKVTKIKREEGESNYERQVAGMILRQEKAEYTPQKATFIQSKSICLGPKCVELVREACPRDINEKDVCVAKIDGNKFVCICNVCFIFS